jgi:DNA-binding FadR family transcriptional regulator
MPAAVAPFRPPSRRRLHEDVAEQLRDAILDGRWAAGSKLPPERELAVRFGVNRTSVRDALKVLEALGLVGIRQGDGATVRPLVEASLDVLAPMIFHGGRVDAALLAEMGEVMQPLLREMARTAIARHRPAHLDAIRALRDVLADAGRSRDDRFAALRDLLVLLADITGNRVWQLLARRTRAFLASAPLVAARERLRRDPGRFVPLIDACLAALAAGRRAAALATLERLIAAVGDPGADVAPRRRPRATGAHR